MLASLPNVHPFLVHFPVALFTTGLVFDLLLFARFREPWLDKAALSVFGIAAVLSIATAWTGKLAADSLAPALDEAAVAAVGSHGDWAFVTVLLFFAVAIVRFDALWRDRTVPLPQLNRSRVLALPLSLAAQACLLATAGRGGELVYRHGVGVVTGP
jgi:uncharacterized membrane protein